jgi:hypothetical protein
LKSGYITGGFPAVNLLLLMILILLLIFPGSGKGGIKSKIRRNSHIALPERLIYGITKAP